MGTLWQDLRYAVRILSGSPGFTAVAVLTLALGIGANTALFSVINGVVLNPLPYPKQEQLVSLRQKTGGSQRSLPYLNFLDYEKDNRTFAAMAGYRQENFSLTGDGEPERLRGEMVSASFFPLLGVKPVLGRVFSADEDLLGGRPVTIISGGLWKRKFGSSAEILGRVIRLSGTDYTIVGVIPARFRLDRANDVYVPIGQALDRAARDRRVSVGLEVVGRLKPNVELDQARADLEAIARDLAVTYPEANRGEAIALTPLKKGIVGEAQSFLFLLLGAVGFVLLIACANVANLSLARSTRRALEFAVRTALGASRARIVRQLLTESVLVAFAGGALGLLLASLGTRSVLAALPAALPRADEIRIDQTVLVFALLVSAFVGIAFGLTPAVKASNPDLNETLKESGRGSSGARYRLQGIFVTAELALALVLLIGAGLMVRSLARLGSVKPGFNPRNVLTFSLSIPKSISASPEKMRTYLRELHDKLDGIPGVEASSVSLDLPLSGDFEAIGFWPEGQPKPASDHDMSPALWYAVGPEYFKAMGIPLRRGRLLSSMDDEHSPFVVVIDELFARKYFAGKDPTGKHIHLMLEFPEAEIVGVVGHVSQISLDSTVGPPFQEQLYFPFVQFPDRHLPHFAPATAFVMRTADAPLTFVTAVRQALGQMNTEQVMYDEKTMDEVVSDSLAGRRFSMILLDIFAALALVLASVGIYGVVSYFVGQRTHEMGIRTALGAQPKDVLKLVLKQSGRIVLSGVTAGLLGAFALTRLMAGLLYGISASDPLTFAGVALLLTLVALVACYFPARRATLVDPIVALRCE